MFWQKRSHEVWYTVVFTEDMLQLYNRYKKTTVYLEFDFNSVHPTLYTLYKPIFFHLCDSRLSKSMLRVSSRDGTRSRASLNMNHTSDEA